MKLKISKFGKFGIKQITTKICGCPKKSELGPTLLCQFLMSHKSAVNTYLGTCLPSSFHNMYGRKYVGIINITKHWQSVEFQS